MPLPSTLPHNGVPTGRDHPTVACVCAPVCPRGVSTSIRGGGEYGDEWHDAGKLFNKQNVFDDFCACGDHLVAKGVTTKGT